MIILEKNHRFLHSHIKSISPSSKHQHTIVDTEDYWLIVNFINKNQDIADRLQDYIDEYKRQCKVLNI